MRPTTILCVMLPLAMGFGSGILSGGGRNVQPGPATETTQAAPAPAADGPDFVDVTITLEMKEGRCVATLGTKDVVGVNEDQDGVEWQVKNSTCTSGSWELKIRGHGQKKKLPASCRLEVEVPTDLAAGQTLDPPPTCYFPGARKTGFTKYAGKYEYRVRVCRLNGTQCKDADPEIELKRR